MLFQVYVTVCYIQGLCPGVMPLPCFLSHVQIPFQRSCGWTEIVFSIDKKEVEREICAVTTMVSNWIHLTCTTLLPTMNIRLAVVFYDVYTTSNVFVFLHLHSKMINLSVPDTIDERTINKKKLTAFTIQVS